MILRLNTNSSCNLDCIHCYYKDKVWFDGKTMSLDDAKNILIQAKNIYWDNLRVVFMWWGEPLLYKYLFELLVFAKDLSIEMAITTNWLLLDYEKILKLKKLWVDIILSLEWDKIYNDKVRWIWVFDKLNNIINILEKENIKFVINFTASKNNILQIPFLVNKFASKTSIITFSRYIPYIKSFIKPLSDKDYLILEKISAKYMQKGFFPRQEQFFFRNKKIESEYKFDIKKLKSLYILPDKSVYPSWNLMDYKLGDLNNNNLIDILNNWKIENLYNPENLNWEKCSKCKYKYNCSGDRWVAYFYTWNFWWDDVQCPYFLNN